MGIECGRRQASRGSTHFSSRRLRARWRAPRQTPSHLERLCVLYLRLGRLCKQLGLREGPVVAAARGRAPRFELQGGWAGRGRIFGQLHGNLTAQQRVPGARGTAGYRAKSAEQAGMS